MSKKIDLNAPRNNSSNHKKSKNIHSFYYNNPQKKQEEEHKKVKSKNNNNNKNESANIENQNINSNQDETSSTTNENNSASSISALDALKRRKSKKNDSQGTLKDIILKIPIVKKIILTVMIIFAPIILLLMVFIVIFSDEASAQNSSVAFGMSYYNAECSEITVINVNANNGYTPVSSKTYNLNDYVAGVIYNEVGGLSNLEVYKAFAIAARTYGLAQQQNCTIENSIRKQTFSDITNNNSSLARLIYQAVEETDGIVMTKDNSLFVAEYDAFCYVEKNDNYYILSQQSQAIPISWVTNHIHSYPYTNCPCEKYDQSMTNCWSSSGVWTDGGHGRGMSQWGSYYLATELEYTYDKILGYYYPDDSITFASPNGGSTDPTTIPQEYPQTTQENPPSSPNVTNISNITNIPIKNTNGATPLTQRLDSFLSSKGSSVQNYNAYISNNVNSNGRGTRKGVVAAAISLVNYIYDNYHTSIPYYFGGSYQSVGVDPSFGRDASPSAAPGAAASVHWGFDCSSFVSWAMTNGGYRFSRLTTGEFDSRFSKNSCIITDPSCVGQPGDLINSAGGHVQMIVGVDAANGIYYVAHARSPQYGVLIEPYGMHTSHPKTTKILHMDEFYNNRSNVS